MSPAPASLDRLADRIHAGEVVFFVGAGFSIDSEGLSSELIIKRLLLRLAALDELQPTPSGDALRRLAAVFGVADNLAGLNATVSLAKAHKLESHLARLSARYYELNSWLCQTFAELLLGARPASYADFSAALLTADAKALAESGWAPADKPQDGERLAFSPLPESWWTRSRSTASDPAIIPHLGKLVFIHATGLFDPAIMSGPGYDPRADPSCLFDFARAYGARLRPRHHVVARLAREGLCPTVVTTNFDLLIEGAFRLAGFRSALPAGAPPISTALPRFDVIASPEAFFTRGKAFRTATVVKLHGCAGQLRQTPDELDRLARYLPQLVYTYREIQNWRDDSWAAEFLRTLLRTRAFVFSGYSTADPVLHDTFRSVYEEMARKLDTGGAAADTASAPAYFLAHSSDDRSQSFHANEVLSSASRAVGAPAVSGGVDHPNYLRFAPSWKDTAGRLQLDELMLWLQHRVLRRQQTEALANDLPALATTLLGRRVPREDFKTLRARFAELVAAEAAPIHETLVAPPDPAAAPLSDAEKLARIAHARRRLAEATAWSHGFHPALRREWAHAAALVRAPGSFRAFAELQHPLWYYPAAERPDWTAWSAVLELALHRLGRLARAHWSGLADPPADTSLVATLAAKPTVLLRRHAAESAPRVALTLQIRDHSRPVARRPACPGSPASHAVWTMPEDAVPWRHDRSSHIDIDEAARLENPYALAKPYRVGAVQWCALPPARLIWELALDHPLPPAVLRRLVPLLLGQ